MPRRSRKSELRVYFPPRDDRNYVIGGDTAEGLEHGDDSALEVIEIESGNQAAEFWGPEVDGLTLGEEAYKLGEWYNWALIAIENNKDLTALNLLGPQQLNYPNLYYQEVGADKGLVMEGTKLGWNTNISTRYQMVDQARKYLKEGSLHIYSAQLLDQMEIFCQNHRGKYEAIQGGHDDLVMAYLIAAQMFRVFLTREDTKGDDRSLAPLVHGRIAQPGIYDVDELDEAEPQTREARIIGRIMEERRQEDLTFASTMENLI